MAAVSGKSGRVMVTAAAATLSTNEAAVLSTDGVTLTITDTGKRHWSRSGTTRPDVYSGTTAVPSSQFGAVNDVQGIVTFSTPHSTAPTYTVDISYHVASFLGQTRAWSMDSDNDMLDVTAFSTTTGDAPWRTFIPGLSQAEVTLDRFYAATTGPAFFDRLNTTQDVVVELWLDEDTNERLEAWAYVSGEGFSVPIDEASAEAVTLQVTGLVAHSTN